MERDEPKATSTLAAAPTRKPRGFKIALAIIAVLFLLFVCTIYFLPSFLPIGAIKGIAKTKARELAGVDVDFENLRFGWNGDLVLENISLTPLGPDGEPGEQLLHVREVRTNVALTPLLSGKAIVNSLDVDGFAVTLRRNPDGSLNLPDFEALAAQAAQASVPASPASGRGASLPLSALAAETAPAALPPIEVHRLDLKNGTLGFRDAAADMALEVGLDFMRVEGRTLDDPYTLSGRLLPYPGRPELGDLPFSGRVAMLRGGELDLDGEASLEVEVKTFTLQELAAAFGLAEVLPMAQLDGLLRAAYAGRKAVVQIPEMRMTRTIVGLGGDALLALPDTVAALNAEYDPEPGFLAITDLSMTNDLAAIRARGQADGVGNLAHGVLPAVGLDFSGTMDFAYASGYLASQPLGLPPLPELDGAASFVGKAALPANHTGEPPSPSLSVDFNDGSLGAFDPDSGFTANVTLQGVGLRAAAVAGDDLRLTAQLNLANVPGRAALPQLGSEPVTFTVNGGAALQHDPDATAVELRLADTRAALHATPWSAAASVANVESRVTYDLARDLLQIASAQATVNDAIEAKIVSGSFGGILSGDPRGQADVQAAAPLERIIELIQPLFPADLIPQLAGALRGVTRIKVADGGIDAIVQGEVDNADIFVNIQPGVSQAEIQSPKATLALLAAADIANPTAVTIKSLEANGSAATVRYSDMDGNAAAGQIGPALLKAAGTVDADAMTAVFSALSVDVNGASLALGKDGQQVASVASGLMKTVVAGTETQPVTLPLEGRGDFAVPNLDFGVDNLVFQFRDEQSQFGNVRAKLAVDGYVGPDKRQLVNLRTATLAAAPMAVNSRGQVDLGTGALVAQYAARVAPSGLASLFGYLGLPPALLTDAAVSGTVTYSDAMVEAKGTAQGQLSAGANETYPFEAAHDLSAAWDANSRTLALDVRRLEGGVKTASGEAVATMQAQQSRLLLSHAGSKGLLDVRFNGSAAPTRHLLLGLAGMVPQLYELSNTLHTAQADGVYNAWLQVRDKDEATLSVTMGGVWQGAALSLGGAPFLAEAAQLSAAVEGELAYRENEVRLSRLLLRSDSGMMQADGTAVATYIPDDNHLPAGLGGLNLNLRFVLADLAKAALAFPGVVPAGTGLTGRVDGVLQAAGTAQAIQVSEGAVRFQGFRAATAEGLEVTIPEGGATFGATVSLNPNPPHTGSPFDAFHMVNIRGGAGSIAGVQIRGQTIQDLSAAFQLENGILTLQHARLNAADSLGAQGEMAATVDFNSPDPAAPTRLGNVNVNARFSVADLARTVAMLPGLIPDMGLAGRVDGVLTASGLGSAVRVNEGAVRFQGFRALPAEGVPVSIPDGTATFNGIFDLHFAGRATGSDWDMLRMFNLHEGRAALSGMTVRDKAVSELASAFVLENGILTLQQARLALGGAGAVALNGTVGFNGMEPEVVVQVSMRDIPLSELNSELADYMQFQNGSLSVPAAQGQAAGVAFTGLSEDAILRTLRLSNFTFATGPVQLLTGPVLNNELDKARALMKQSVTENKAREITFSSVQGSATADGSGVITIPQSAPISLIGDNTGDFRAYGAVRSDHTLDMRVEVAGKLENLIGFTLPNIIPNLRGAGQEEQNRFMARMNENAAKGNYGLNIRGNLSSPDISGIGQIAAAFLKDILLAAPGQILGGVVDLGKDAPAALKNVGEAVVNEILNPGEALKNAPENIIRAPENVVKGLGQMFGLTRGDQQQGGQEDGAQEQQQEEQDQQRRPSLRLPFGIR